MSLIRRNLEARSLPPSIDPYGVTARPSIPNYTAEFVNETTALSVSTVLACVTLIADSVASMPVRTFDSLTSKPVEIDTPEWLRRPNDRQTQFQWLSELVASMALHGNGFVAVTRGRRSEVLALSNLHPLAVMVVRNPNTGALTFQSNGHDYSSDDIIHIPWVTVPQRILGLSPLELQRTTLGLALAMERHLAQFYGEGGTPSSVIETDQTMSSDTVTRLQEAWSTNNWRHRKVAVLTGGMKWRPITTSASDMEMQASREHQVREIARAFRVPAYKVGAQGDRSTYQNLESAELDWVRTGLTGWTHRVEQALSSLLPAGQFIKFDPSPLIKPDRRTELAGQQIAVASGIMTPNEARAELGLPPYEGGDRFVMALPGAPMAGTTAELPPVGVDEADSVLAVPGSGA